MDSKLFMPLRLRELELPNRIVVSPMCQYSASGGNAGDWHLMNLGQFAVSGAGLVIVESTAVLPEGRISPCDLSLCSDDNEAALARIVGFCREYGSARLGIQLAHAGRLGSISPPWEGRQPVTPKAGGWRPVAPSAIPFDEGSPVPEALDRSGIASVVDAFASAAARAHRIGFDHLEIHGGHGYLLHQFLSPITNRRTDEYGGSLEGRQRLALEIMTAVREAWPAEKPVGIKLSATDWLDEGINLDETVELTKKLGVAGCDYVCVSSGGISPHARIRTGPAFQVQLSEQVRSRSGLPTVAVGKITQAHQAETIVRTGQADLIALARGMLYDPRWPWHAAAKLGVPMKYPPQYERCHPSMVSRDQVVSNGVGSA